MSKGFDNAFPIPGYNDTGGDYPIFREAKDGLTKREYFAAMAMQGLCADRNNLIQSHGEIASAALEYADQLLSALGKGG